MSDPQSHFVTICPQCSSALKVRRIYLGQIVACKQCKHTFMGTETEEPTAVIPGAQATGPSAQPARNVERIEVVCENCKISLSVKTSKIGQVIRCKQCEREILVKAARETQQAPALAASGSGSVSADDLLPLATDDRRGDEKYNRLRSERAVFQAEFEKLSVAHNLLEAEIERLRLAHSQVVFDKKRLSEQLEQLAAGQDARRAKEGWIPPAEARSWVEERGSLRDEIDRLRDETRELRAEQSGREELAKALEERTTDLASVRAERDSLGEQLKQREEKLDATRAEKVRADAEQSGREELAKALEERTTDLASVRTSATH